VGWSKEDLYRWRFVSGLMGFSLIGVLVLEVEALTP